MDRGRPPTGSRPAGGRRRAFARCSRPVPRPRERVEETGTRGEGGDRTLVIDEAAEELVFAQLDELHARGHRFTAISEERGEVDYGGGGAARRHRPDRRLAERQARAPRARALDRASPTGRRWPTCSFGYVFDLGAGEEWTAVRGEGAQLDGEPLAARPRRAPLPRRAPGGRRPGVRRPALGRRGDAGAGRGRAPPARDRLDRALAVPGRGGALRRHGLAVALPRASTPPPASSSCARPAARSRSPSCDAPLGAPLDTEPRSPVIAARSAAALRELARVPLGLRPARRARTAAPVVIMGRR